MAKQAGGFYYGYIVVLASFLILLLVFGVHYTFGLYVKPIFAEFGWGMAAISGAYSLSWLIQGPSGMIMGKLNDKYGPRMVLSLCGVSLFIGIILTTQIKESYQLYLSYGLFTGIGTGGIYVPIVSTITKWFAQRRGVMTGIAISGMGFGTFVMSPVANYLISNYSWRVSYSVLGTAMLMVVLLSAQCLKSNPESLSPGTGSKGNPEGKAPAGPSVSLKEAVSQVGFWMILVMFFCFGYCLMAMLVHIVPHAIEIGKSPAAAAGLVSVIGIASIGGKVFFGYFGDRLGSKATYIICFGIMFGSLWLPICAAGLVFLYGFSVLFGLAYGGNACAQGPLVADIFGLKAHGEILGTLIIGFTTGAAVGPLLTGYLFDINGSYTTAFYIASSFSALGLALAFTLGGRPARS